MRVAYALGPQRRGSGRALPNSTLPGGEVARRGRQYLSQDLMPVLPGMYDCAQGLGGGGAADFQTLKPQARRGEAAVTDER